LIRVIHGHSSFLDSEILESKTPLPAAGTALKFSSSPRRPHLRSLAFFVAALFGGHGRTSRLLAAQAVASRRAAFTRHNGGAIRFPRPRGKSFQLGVLVKK